MRGRGGILAAVGACAVGLAAAFAWPAPAPVDVALEREVPSREAGATQILRPAPEPASPTPSATPGRVAGTTTAAPKRTAAPSPRPAPTYAVNEQFDGAALNPALWEVMTYPKAFRNHEEQAYVPGQVRVADGKLQLTASRQADGQWLSGEVHSRWQYRYGEFETRLAVSAAAPGVWPAAWLMGAGPSWPDNGEIDIYESINGQPTAYGSIHAGGSNGHWFDTIKRPGIDVTQYHTYKVIVAPGLISWWVDGQYIGQWRANDRPAGAVWPFDSFPKYALLNLAIGGDWPGPSSAVTPSEVTLSIDYFTVKTP